MKNRVFQLFIYSILSILLGITVVRCEKSNTIQLTGSWSLIEMNKTIINAQNGEKSTNTTKYSPQNIIYTFTTDRNMFIEHPDIGSRPTIYDIEIIEETMICNLHVSLSSVPKNDLNIPQSLTPIVYSVRLNKAKAHLVLETEDKSNNEYKVVIEYILSKKMT